jgi:hypothetical protein
MWTVILFTKRDGKKEKKISFLRGETERGSIPESTNEIFLIIRSQRLKRVGIW